MCLLTTLYASTVGCDEDDTSVLQIVNESLNIARDINALRFPAMLTPLIWSRYKPNLRVEPEHKERYVNRLLKRTPCWMLYSDETTMREDINKLIEVCWSVPIARPQITNYYA